MQLVAVALIGVIVGFLGGMFGKGGSAIATPMLNAAGISAFSAVASPLPATIPATLIASYAYWRAHAVDWRLVWWSVAFGMPATIGGAIATRWIDGSLLVHVTDAIPVLLGVRFVFWPQNQEAESAEEVVAPLLSLAAVCIAVGVISGLLANSGGFLLAPLYMVVLRLPIRPAFATSLAVSAALAVPGTIVHAALGHIEWTVVFVFACGSIPLSFVGAKVALRTNAAHLERIYGVAIGLLGAGFLIFN